MEGLSKVISELSLVENHSDVIREKKVQIEEAFYNLEDVTREIRDIGSEITYDEDRLAEINERIYSISLYKKKYGNSIKEILDNLKNLKEKYNDVHLIDNPYFDTCNNISSLYVAREHLKNVIILDGDQIINNSQILEKNFDFSGYNCIYKKEINNEWMLKIKEGLVTSCSRTGGKDGWQLYSVSRWNEEDGKRLKKHLEIEFEEKKNTEIYWDDVALFCYPDEYQLSIKEMHDGDILEIDSLDELCSIDPSYLNYREN